MFGKERLSNLRRFFRREIFLLLREKFQFIKSRYLAGGHPRRELFLDGGLRCPAVGEYVNINPCPPHSLKIKV